MARTYHESQNKTTYTIRHRIIGIGHQTELTDEDKQTALESPSKARQTTRAILGVVISSVCWPCQHAAERR